MLHCLSFNAYSQNKMGFTWIVGFNVDFAKFDGTNTAPTVGQRFSASHPSTPMMFTGAHSEVCDSVTGNIILSTGGMKLYDSTGYLIENGDSLQPVNVYTHNSIPDLGNTQGSIILPKGTDNKYYVFIPTVSDSFYNLFWTNPNGYKAPFDLLRYNVVDMNLNGGHGKVIQKNKILLQNIELSKVMMQACRHANGVDWWLLKHASNTNTIYRFLVTKDSIIGPYIQTFNEPLWGWFDIFGQCAFSKDGTKYGAVMGKSNKLFLADFDRCTGELFNPQIFNIPIDSTTWEYWDTIGVRDSISDGIAFSDNNHFLYISKYWNIYQYELNQPDSSLAWYRVKHGIDTSFLQFEYYGQMYRGPNKRIYIGKVGGSFKQFSVIDNPDIKGVACGFCRKCFRIDTADGGLTSPPNMPDFELGPSSKLCWPLSTPQLEVHQSNELEIYPNPVCSQFILEFTSNENRIVNLEIYNPTGQLIEKRKINTNQKLSIDILHLIKGIYFIKAEGSTKKLNIE